MAVRRVREQGAGEVEEQVERGIGLLEIFYFVYSREIAIAALEIRLGQSLAPSMTMGLVSWLIMLQLFMKNMGVGVVLSGFGSFGRSCC